MTTSVQRIWYRFSASWPGRALWLRVHAAVQQWLAQLPRATAGPEAAPAMPK